MRLIIILIFFSQIVRAQVNKEKIDTVYVSTEFTTTIIFPKDIILSDIGNEDFGGISNGNLLLLKAAIDNGKPTSLTVKYGDDLLLCTIAYSANAIRWIDLRSKEVTKIEEVSRVSKQDSLKTLSKEIATKRLGLIMGDKEIVYKSRSIRVEQLGLALTNMAVDKDNVYLKFLVDNGSKLDYEIDFAEFIYRDPLSSKDLKGGYDRRNVYPVVQSDVLEIEAKKRQFIGYAIPRFALSKKGDLQFVLREKTGSRVLELFIPFEEILDSEQLTK